MKREEIIRVVSRFLENHRTKYDILRIGIFGSAARDNMTDTSDVDIVVDLVKPDYFALVGIKQTLEKQLKLQVDIVRYRESMNRHLKERIDRETIYV